MAEPQFVLCRACGRQVRMEQVTFDSIKKVYVCNTCNSRAHTTATSLTKSKTQDVKPSIFGTKEEKEVIIKYACPNCKYRFSKKKGKETTKCPYCGGSKLEEVSNQASKILEDSDNFNF
ncbi:MAG: hypothetical protein WC758_02550 [Candidatus Woesearchaeota archaeon]|jgi:DNA-directed RNA polymerase subunit RPC12/RpoP